LEQDFNSVCQALHRVLVESYADRADLARQLERQRIAFYRNLVHIELRLALYGWYRDRMPAIDLVGPLEILQAQLRELAGVST
jgi:hypothetical protein